LENWTLIQKIAIFALPVLFAITVHEAAHGYAARHFGDRTAEMMGRLSLNPVRHIDLVGTILMPLLTLAVSPFMFGWAKPVPVDFRNLRNPKKDMFWVAAAGPASNFVMAIAWAVVRKIAIHLNQSDAFYEPLVYMGEAGVLVNVVIMVLNLLPIPPLDGGRILVSLLPPRAAWQVARIEPYGMYILILLIMTHVLSAIMQPFVELTFRFIDLIL